VRLVRNVNLKDTKEAIQGRNQRAQTVQWQNKKIKEAKKKTKKKLKKKMIYQTKHCVRNQRLSNKKSTNQTDVNISNRE
jgi:hypothetical protein